MGPDRQEYHGIMRLSKQVNLEALKQRGGGAIHRSHTEKYQFSVKHIT